MEFLGILFDTRSIQRYIFSGNRLKTNIGASCLVDRVFDDVLVKALQDVYGTGEVDAATWREVEAPDWEAQETACRIGFFGGGKALVLVKRSGDEENDQAQARAVVTQFTKALLTKAPGLRTGAAIGRLRLAADGTMARDGNEDDADDYAVLVRMLKEQQNTIAPVVTLPYTGLTLCCPENDGTAAAWDAEDQRFYSWEVEMKLRADRRRLGQTALAEDELLEKLRSVLPEEERETFLAGYAFPQEFEKLGQRETENDIAIVHIDGNNMGRQFQDCKTLTEYKNLSLRVRQTTITAFAALTKELVQKRETGRDSYLDTCHQNEDGDSLLPIRPIVLGGDDMTFVCAAKIALRSADTIMQHMKADGINTCAGIAILKTAYPFFRGYQMAEQLCGAAKKKMRNLPAGDPRACWLDFAILHGEQAPTLEELRAQEYGTTMGPDYRLHFGPYCVDATEDDPHALANLFRGIEEMRTSLPTNKAKELRSVLAHGRHAQTQFHAQLAYLEVRRGRTHAPARLPQLPAWKADAASFWDEEHRTPYVDAIELMDDVPEEAENA